DGPGAANRFGTAGLGVNRTVNVGGINVPAPWLNESGIGLGDSGSPALVSALPNSVTGLDNAPALGGSTTPLSMVGVAVFNTAGSVLGSMGGYVRASAFNLDPATAAPAAPGFILTAMNNTPYGAILDMRLQVLGAGWQVISSPTAIVAAGL